uniref:Uncharacterized protein n=1 Tax=Anopheles atroparvus TaxID=41427 RepID=A0AAG5D0M9_ANOAO
MYCIPCVTIASLCYNLEKQNQLVAATKRVIKHQMFESLPSE